MRDVKFKIKEWPDADLVIEDIGRAIIERNRLEGEMNQKIADAKASYGERIQTIDAQIADWEARLEGFCKAHRGEMEPVKGGKGVAHKGPFGKVAFRACPAAIVFVTKKMEKVLAALKARKLTNCIRTIEEPNKDVMLALDDVTLAAVHARRKPGEKFEVKPDYDAIESTIVVRESA